MNYNDTARILGMNLRMLRTEYNLSQADLALKIGIGTDPKRCSLISQYEGGLVMPRVFTLRKLALYFGVSMDRFFEVA